MAMRVPHTYLFLILLATVVVMHSKPQIASQVVYHKLEDALIADSNVLYMMQEVFIPSKILPRDLVFLHVCKGKVQRGSFDNSSLLGGQSNFTYCQYFQWSSSALVDLISFDQLFILDNVISYNVFQIIEHRRHLDVPLHIDTLPCETMEDDILAALMQLLPWVCINLYLHLCACAYVLENLLYHNYFSSPCIYNFAFIPRNPDFLALLSPPSICTGEVLCKSPRPKK